MVIMWLIPMQQLGAYFFACYIGWQAAVLLPIATYAAIAAILVVMLEYGWRLNVSITRFFPLYTYMYLDRDTRFLVLNS